MKSATGFEAAGWIQHGDPTGNRKRIRLFQKIHENANEPCK
jgi:hypothetical protein